MISVHNKMLNDYYFAASVLLLCSVSLRALYDVIVLILFDNTCCNRIVLWNKFSSSSSAADCSAFFCSRSLLLLNHRQFLSIYSAYIYLLNLLLPFVFIPFNWSLSREIYNNNRTMNWNWNWNKKIKQLQPKN